MRLRVVATTWGLKIKAPRLIKFFVPPRIAVFSQHPGIKGGRPRAFYNPRPVVLISFRPHRGEISNPPWLRKVEWNTPFSSELGSPGRRIQSSVRVGMEVTLAFRFFPCLQTLKIRSKQERVKKLKEQCTEYPNTMVYTLEGPRRLWQDPPISPIL